MTSPRPPLAQVEAPIPISAFAPVREPNFQSPLCINGGAWRVFDLRADVESEAYELIYRVTMDVVEKATSNHFGVTVHIFWESIYDPDFEPGPDILFGIARKVIREHFETHRYPPRFSSHRFGVQLRWPELDETEPTV